MTEEIIFRIMIVLSLLQMWAMIYILKKIMEIELELNKKKDKE